MYYNEFKMIIEKILKGEFDKKLLGEYLICLLYNSPRTRDNMKSSKKSSDLKK